MKKDIFQGPTFQGKISYLGLMVIIAGIFISLKYIISIGIIVLVIGIFLFLNIKGVIIDMKKGIVKPYFLLLFFKLGKQYNLKDFNNAVLKFHKDAVRMNSRGSSGEYRTKSFDVYLINVEGTTILLKQFSKKKQAEVFQNQIIKMLGLV